LEIAGIQSERKHRPDGESLVPLLRRSGRLKRNALFWHYPHFSNQGGMPGAAVRQGDFKLIRFFEDERVELYNLKDDLGEEHDLSGRKPQKAVELAKLLEAWLAAVGANRCRPNPHHQAR
jgi:arylsulfatase A-like enzyme